jgi:predicted patatin/cPLA2 family phospholipase
MFSKISKNYQNKKIIVVNQRKTLRIPKGERRVSKIENIFDNMETLKRSQK